MSQYILTISENKVALSFLDFIKNLDFVENVVEFKKQDTIIEKSGDEEYDDFKQLFGIWENSDISEETIRTKAWPKRAV